MDKLNKRIAFHLFQTEEFINSLTEDRGRQLSVLTASIERREGTSDFEQAKALFKAGYRVETLEEERDMSPKGEYGRFTANVTVTVLMDGYGTWKVAQVIDSDIEPLLRLLVELPEWGCTETEEYVDPLVVLNHLRDLTLEE